MTREEFLNELEELLELAIVDCPRSDVRQSAFSREAAVLADKIFPLSDPSAKV